MTFDPARGRLPHLSLLARFSALSLVSFLAIAGLLFVLVEAEIRRRAITHDGEAVRYLAELVGDRTSAEELGAGLRAETRQDIARFLRYDHHGPEYRDLWIWNRRGDLLYHLDPAGAEAPDPAVLGEVLAGGSVSRIDPATGERPEMLRYAVPLVPAGAAEVQGALVVEQDLGPVAGEVAALARSVGTVLFGGLALLYVVLLPIVAAASRRLRVQAAQNAYQALHDDLTGLPNRRALQAELAALDDHASGLELAIVDLDAFKALNTRYGQAHGDAALCQAAERLRAVLPRGAWLSRLGGDEFAVLLDATDPDAALRAVEDACRAMGGIQVQDVRLGASGGLAVYPHDARDGSLLLERAFAALAGAKEAGRGQVRRYQPGYDALLVPLEHQRAEIEALLARPERIVPVFQPIVALATGAVAGYEALSRISSDPLRPPDQWFAQAHRCDLGDALEALAAQRALAAPGRPPGTYLALNFAPSALRSPEVRAVLPEDLDGLVIEITEHELIADAQGLAATIADLRARNARIAVDDAGAGYAGLTHLMQIAPDVIKLDRAMIDGVDTEPNRAAFVQALVGYARQRGVQLCAEGVETLDQLRVLRDLGVDTGQGWALARPAADWPPIAPAAAEACLAAPEPLSGAARG